MSGLKGGFDICRRLLFRGIKVSWDTGLLAAESGRVVLGRLKGDRICLEEIHRFRNEPVSVRGRLYWDIL